MSVIKIGADIGNGYTKYIVGGEFHKFATRIASNFSELGKNVHRIKIDEKEYIIGNGNKIIGKDRYYTKEYLYCLLTAIALSCPKNEIEVKNDVLEVAVSIGVPTGIHEYHQAKLKPYLEELGVQKIIVDEEEYNIKIVKAIIVPEGSLGMIFPAVHEGHNLVLDIGEGTVDTTEWVDGKVKDRKTSSDACAEFYADTIKTIQREKGDCFVKENQIQRVVETKKFTNTIDEEIISKNLKIYINNIFNLVGLDIEAELNNVYMIGGGAYMLEGVLSEYLEEKGHEETNVQVLENAEYINVILYKEILDTLWKQKFGDDN